MEQEILNDEELALITQFVGNGKMVEAVKKVLLASLYDNGTLKPGVAANPLKNWALGAFFSQDADKIDDKLLGQSIRASAMGIQMLESGINKLVEIATPVKKKEEGEGSNPAR
jgi:hypothetical protein